MSQYALRKAGGSVMVTIPPAYLKAHGLKPGSSVEVREQDGGLFITPVRSRLRLCDLLDAAPEEAQSLRAPGWDELPPAGREA